MHETSDASPRLVRRLRSASRILSIGVLALGLLMLLARPLGFTVPPGIPPSLVAMRASAALLFVLLGLGFWSASRGFAPGRRAAGLAVLLIAAVSLAEYGFDTDLGIDWTLSRGEAAGTLSSRRMAPATALNFLLLGLALLLLDARAYRRLGDAAILVAAAISFVAFCGYLYHAPSLYTLGPRVLIALPTALGFFACALAYLGAQPDVRRSAVLTSDTLAGTLLRRMLPWIVIAPLTLSWLVIGGMEAGVYDSTLGVAILTAANVCILAAATSVVARSLRSSELQRRRAELAVGTSERRLRQLVEGSPYAVAMFDREMRYLFASGRWLSDYRLPLTSQQIRGRSHYDVFPEMSQSWREFHRRGLAGEVAQSDAEAFARADGGVDWLRWEIRPWRDDAGDVGGILLFSEDISTRKRAELELKRWEHVFQNAAWGMVLSAPDQRCIVVNHAFAEMHGTTVEHWVDRPLADMFAEASRPLLPDLEGRLHDAGHVSYESMHVRADGSTFPVLTVASAFEDKESGARFHAASCQDITERERLEHRFRLALDAAPTGMLMIDRAGDIALVNAHVEELFGYSRSELLGKPCEMLIPVRLRGRHPQHREAFFTSPRARVLGVDRELHGLRKDGSEFPLEIGLNPLDTPDGPFVLSSVVDISERKRAERERAELIRQREVAQRASERSRFFELSLDLVCIAKEGHFLQLNPAFASTLGYSIDELLATPYLELVHPEDRAATSRAVTSLLTGQPTLEFTNRYRCKDGSYRWLQWRSMPDADGTLYAVARDVTAHRALLDELRSHQASLTASLKERDVLLQEVHHRVKNNLQVICSLINLQTRQIRDEGARAALGECRSRVEAIALVHEKLYQSKSYSNVPFAEYVQGVASMAFRAAGAAQRSISLDLSVDEGAVPVDRAIPCGIILNELITNALKHAFPHAKKGTIRVDFHRDDDRMVLAVSDDGVGLRPKLGPEASTSLGMQLVGALVEQLDGRLEVATAEGTEIRISFPAGEVA